jgi:hypothetical protein
MDAFFLSFETTFGLDFSSSRESTFRNMRENSLCMKNYMAALSTCCCTAAIAIFVHIGIGKVGKLFSNQGNPLFSPEPEYFYARVYEGMKPEGKGQKSGFPAVVKKLCIMKRELPW